MRRIVNSACSIGQGKRNSYLTAMLAVLTGGLIYILFRPVEPLFFSWANNLASGDILSGIRKFSLPMLSFIPEWLIFSAPNGLWAFAYTLIILKIWSGSKSRIRFFWFATIPVWVVGYELLQLFTFLPGTFCWIDTLFSLTGITVGMALVSNK